MDEIKASQEQSEAKFQELVESDEKFANAKEDIDDTKESLGVDFLLPSRLLLRSLEFANGQVHFFLRKCIVAVKIHVIIRKMHVFECLPVSAKPLRARSRLYRSRCLRGHIHFAAFVKLYSICALSSQLSTSEREGPLPQKRGSHFFRRSNCQTAEDFSRF